MKPGLIWTVMKKMTRAQNMLHTTEISRISALLSWNLVKMTSSWVGNIACTSGKTEKDYEFLLVTYFGAWVTFFVTVTVSDNLNEKNWRKYEPYQ